jgi:hypothetical protein
LWEKKARREHASVTREDVKERKKNENKGRKRLKK